MIWMIYGALALGALTIIIPLMGVIRGSRSLAALSASATPMQDFILEAGGPTMATAISVSVALAIFNAMIAIVLIGGRIYYSAARENAFHPRLNRMFAQVHKRYGSPSAATLAVGLAGLPICFVPLSVLVVISGNGNAMIYALMALAMIMGRRSGATARSSSPMPLFPLGPVVVIAVAVCLVLAGLSDNGSGRAGILTSLGIMAAGMAYYRLFVCRSDVWAHHDPDEEASAEEPWASSPAATAPKPGA
jgi:amino acid transporter